MNAAVQINRILPWRFALFFACLVVGWAVGLALFDWTRALLVGFDVASAIFLLSCISTFREDVPQMREVAANNDANRAVLLGLSVLMTVVILAAVIIELTGGSQLSPWHKGLIALSLVLVWTFGNAVYALHYAHLFYTANEKGADCGGLDFPGTKLPLMGDFVYFAFTLGVAVQTSDVQVTSRHFRNVVTAHCVIGFFFNLGVLALTINVLGQG